MSCITWKKGRGISVFRMRAYVLKPGELMWFSLHYALFFMERECLSVIVLFCREDVDNGAGLAAGSGQRHVQYGAQRQPDDTPNSRRAFAGTGGGSGFQKRMSALSSESSSVICWLVKSRSEPVKTEQKTRMGQVMHYIHRSFR